MKTMNLKQMIRKSAGYTIDQTILIVAVIAILITLIIASVGWDLLNRTSGTKFASYLKQIEEANGAFYARQGVWPHMAVDDIGVITGAAADNYIGILAANDPLGVAANDYLDRWKPFLNGFDIAVTAGTDAVVSHEFGNGGVISQDAVICNGADNDGHAHLEITFLNVPLTETLNADEAIDGELDEANGRLTYDDQVALTQDVLYCGNLLN